MADKKYIYQKRMLGTVLSVFASGIFLEVMQGSDMFVLDAGEV